MSENQLKQIEESIKEAKKDLDLAESLTRLKSNRDFKKLVIEGYFEAEAIRLVHLKADPSVQAPAVQQSIVNQIDAIGALSGYFATVNHRAYLAAKSIEADEEMRDEILAEELAQ